jgi:ABC-2 type transport system permease protein
MTAAFWYLTTRTLRNRVMGMLRRVKQPRYAIGMLFVVVYFGFLGWGQMTGFGGKPRQSLFQNESLRTLAPLVMAIVLMANWIGGGAMQALAFTQAEVAMLFPAPVSRRALILLKIARAQIPILINVVIMTLLWGGRSATQPVLLSAIGLYTLFATMHLNRIGVALVLASTFRHGAGGLKRNWVSIAIGVLVGSTVALAIIASLPGMGDGDSPLGAFMARMTNVLSTTWVRAVLFPFELITAPAFASTPGDWALAFLGASVIGGLHLWWVLRSHASFEEAAAEQSARLHAMLESFRKRGTLAPQEKTPKRRMTIPLRPLGHPAVAIIWKNSLAFIRTISALTWILVLFTPVIVLVMTMDSGAGAFAAAGVLAAILAFLLLLLGGMIVRNDLRGDLLNLSSLKTLPMRGSTIVFAEVASSALPLAIVQCVLMWMAIAGAMLGKKPPPISATVSALVVMPLAVIALNLLTSTVRNAAAVLFPAWTQLGVEGSSGGFEVMGQAMLGIAATLLGIAVLLIAPAVVTFVVVAWIQPPVAVGLVTSVVVGSAAVVGQAYLVMLWIGRVLERTEPSAALTAT